MQQLAIDLYGPMRKVRTTDPPTSRRAALAAWPRSGSQRERILTAIIDAPLGLTYDAVAEATGIVAVSVSTRITELARGEWIEQAGERETSAGGKAVVWVASAKARGSVAA